MLEETEITQDTQVTKTSGAAGWIGCDLDGTLAHYTHWVAPTHIGAPIAPMVARVKAWLAEGKTVKILTARINVPGMSADDTYATERAIRAFCKEHIGQELDVTCSKDTDMVELWDDRAVQVIANTGESATSQAYSNGFHDGRAYAYDI